MPPGLPVAGTVEVNGAGARYPRVPASVPQHERHPPHMNVRRSAAALAASAVLCAGAARGPRRALPLPGAGRPLGSVRQGRPDVRRRVAPVVRAARPADRRRAAAAQAVDWLVGQQCADGGFASFRADASKACDAKTVLDTNATAVAVQALAALGGHDAAVKKGVDWLKSVQNEDGGWAYVPGSPSEGSSTSVVISALAVAGEKPADVKSKAGKSAYDGLLSFQLGCSAEPPPTGAPSGTSRPTASSRRTPTRPPPRRWPRSARARSSPRPVRTPRPPRSPARRPPATRRPPPRARPGTSPRP